MHQKNTALVDAFAAAVLSVAVILMSHSKSSSGQDIDDKIKTHIVHSDQLAEKIAPEKIEWIQDRLFIDGKERKPGGSIRIWIFNVDSAERDITALFVQQSLKRLILGYGDDEVLLNRDITKTMQSLHKPNPAGAPIHIHTSEAVYFGDQGCEFDLKYSYSDGTTTERLGLDFCGNVRGTSGTSGQVGLAVDGGSVFELDSYLAASKSRPYWNKIERYIVKHWHRDQ